MTDLTDRMGKAAGFCLGLAVDAAGKRLDQTHALPGRITDPDFLQTAEAEITWYAGRYAVLVTNGVAAHVYGDPAGALPLVYNAERRVVAASVLLALDRAIEDNPDFDPAAVSGLSDLNAVTVDSERAAPKGGYGFGGTADRAVQRLVPNHRLSLGDFHETRFWPTEHTALGAEPPSIPGKARALAERLGTVCNALVGDDPAQFALSGGHDSRMLLGAASDGLNPNISLFSHAMSWSTHMDTLVARLIARRIGRDLRVIVPQDGYRGAFDDEERQKQALLRHDISSGFVCPLNEHFRRGVMDWFPDGEILLRGNMLELVKAVWWPRVRAFEQTDPFEHALMRCRVAIGTDVQRDTLAARQRAWFDGLPRHAQPYLHDFNYFENGLPYTQAGLISVNNCFYVAPACDRRILELCIGVPYRKRRRGVFLRHVANHARPDLFDLPTPNKADEAALREMIAASA